MTKWIKISEELPTVKAMLKKDILILRENKTFATGVFYYDRGGNIERMNYGGTGKHIDDWRYKPTHWAAVDLPEDL